MSGKEWASGSLLVRVVKPIVAAYQPSAVNRGLAAIGRTWRNSAIRGYMARVAGKRFHTETSVFYRVLNAMRTRRDKAADAFHNALREPVVHSGLYGASTKLYRAAADGQGRYAVIGALLSGFGLGFAVVAMVLHWQFGAEAAARLAGGESAGFFYGSGLGLNLVAQLAVAGACVVLGAAVYALRGYLAAHAKDSLLVRLFMYLFASEDETARDERG